MSSPPLDTAPLYRRVKERLVARLADGAWAPGEALPSEMALAREMNVHQGTVRKALDEMAAENLVTRRQGRGTFVADHSDDRILFNFFKLTGADGIRRFPESRVLACARAIPTDAEREALALTRVHRIVRIARIRSIEGTPVIAETIAVPAKLFPGFETRTEIPNNLYALYAAEFGIRIARASEGLSAVAADRDTARALGLSPGAPLLRIARTAFALDGQPVEYRDSACRTDDLTYEADLR